MTEPLNVEALADFRRRKDEHFKSGRGPLQGEALAQFSGLSYFPAAPEWQFILPLQDTTETAEFTLDTNSGEARHMALLGTVNVPLPDGETHALQVFAPLGEENPQRVFIPFRDLTSGEQTYGAGRYLDAPLLDGNEGRLVVVNFNLAYHPYCAYGEGWVCPLPPAQNRLNVAVNAGEKLP